MQVFISVGNCDRSGLECQPIRFGRKGEQLQIRLWLTQGEGDLRNREEDRRNQEGDHRTRAYQGEEGEQRKFEELDA